MDSTRLEQRHFFTRLTYQIIDNGIAATERTIFTPKKYKVPFENISLEATEVTVSSKFRFWVMIIFFSLALMTGLLKLFSQDVGGGAYLIWMALGIIAGVSFLLSRETFLVYGSGELTLVVYKDKPTPEALAAFVDEVQCKKHDYLLQHYLLDTTVSSSVDAIHKLTWLRNEGAITDKEFEILKAEVVQNSRWGGSLPHSTN